MKIKNLITHGSNCEGSDCSGANGSDCSGANGTDENIKIANGITDFVDDSVFNGPFFRN